MKKISTVYYLIIAILISTVTIAQPEAQEPSQIQYISNRTVNLVNEQEDYTGSPYFNEDFVSGNILSKGKTIATNQIVRYNVNKEEFEIRDSKDSNSKTVKTILRSENITIEMGDHSFEYISDAKNKLRGYFIPLITGGKNSLYKKIKKEYIPSQKAINSMTSDVAALYKEKEILYLVDGDGKFIELTSSKKDRLNAFGDTKKNVKDYAKQNKLNLKKEEDLIKIVTYTNSL